MKTYGNAIKKITALLLILVMCAAMAACSGGSEPTEAGESVLVYGSSDYTRINPAMDEHGEINVLLFDGLTDHDKDNQIIPCLAESWEYDADSHTYTFALRKGVKWHDGEEFTAEDVKFTIEAIMEPENGSENASNYEDVVAVNVIDPYTVEFVLSEHNYAFIEYMSIGMLPKHLLEGEDMQTSAFFNAPVGTGIYKLESWDEGQSITLVRNEDYFLGTANIDKIIFKIVNDDAARALQLKTGELDLAQVTPSDARSFEGEAGYRIYQMNTSDYRGILYNFGNEYWQKNGDLIPAFNYAIDRERMIAAVLLGAGEAAYGPLQRNEYNYDGVEHYDYDPKKAEALLEELGCTKGGDGFYYRNGEKISFVISVGSGDSVRLDMARIAAQQLGEIGIDVTVEVPARVDWGGQYCYLIGWGSPFDADDHTYKVFGTGKGANYSGYSNESVDKYLTQARQTEVKSERAEAYRNFQTALSENPAYTFFCYVDAFYAAKDSLHGIDENMVLGHHGVGIFRNVKDWTI